MVMAMAISQSSLRLMMCASLVASILFSTRKRVWVFWVCACDFISNVHFWRDEYLSILVSFLISDGLYMVPYPPFCQLASKVA